MPIYEYVCQKCNAHIEMIHKFSDKPLTRHNKCGGKLEKQWSKTSFQLKGSGWYVTDYAGKKSDAKETSKEKKSESKTETAVSSEPAKSSKTSTTSSAPSGD